LCAVIFGIEKEDGVDEPPSQAEIEHAAAQANAHGFISAFPQGYDTGLCLSNLVVIALLCGGWYCEPASSLFIKRNSKNYAWKRTWELTLSMHFALTDCGEKGVSLSGGQVRCHCGMC
jgi:hypothetical protein